MALEKELPFWVAELTLNTGGTCSGALLHQEIGWLDEPAAAVARDFERAADKSWSREGELLPWTRAVTAAAFEVETLDIHYPASRKSRLHPEMTLRFDVAVGQTAEDRFTGVVPALSVTAVAADRVSLRASLADNIRLAMTRDERLSSGGTVLSTQWYEGLRLIDARIDVRFYTPAELAAFKVAPPEALLPDAAERFRPTRRRVFEVDEALDKLSALLDRASTRAVVLVGPSGVGKSALVEELVRAKRWPRGETVWETDAARLARSLTTGDGWQENLSRVARELRIRRDWLWVRNLAELFEVGRYVGNDVSIGEYLRDLLAGGEIGFISECTSEQAARIEARYPGFLELTRRVEVTEPTPERLEATVLARARVTAGKRTVEPGAAREALRLQRRFAPYSGFPGRTVRFLEALITSSEATAPLDRASVLRRFCEETGMPRSLIDPDVAEPRPAGPWFQERIYGQPEAVQTVLDVLAGVRADVTRRGQPVASLLFVGPTGVGKTETAKVLASFMFGSPDRLTRFDMSEFSSPAAALRLTEGSQASGEGLLTGAVRREPFSVILLDEIEKADPLVFDLLLQVLGEGRLTDGAGRVADFCSAVIVMTSNLGARDASRGRGGFVQDRAAEVSAVFNAAVQRHFRPEFFNRIDRVVTFTPLGPPAIERVLRRDLDKLGARAGFRTRRAALDVSEEAREALVRIGYDPVYGARHLQRALRDQVMTPAAAALNGRRGGRALRVRCALEAGALSVSVVDRAEGRESLSARARLEAHADRADEARRLADKVRAGATFARLSSTIAIMERRKRRVGKQFWQTPDAGRYSRFIRAREACAGMFEAAGELGVSALVDTLTEGDAAARSAAMVTRLAAYDALAVAARRALFDTINADEAPILVGAYGPLARVEGLLDRYQAVCEALDLPCARANIWLLEETKDIKDGAEYTHIPEGQRPPPGGLHQQVGAELSIHAPGATSLFSGEVGGHLWDGPPEQRLVVKVLTGTWAQYEPPKAQEERLKEERPRRPTDLHRRAATQGRWRRRHRSDDSLEDRHYKLRLHSDADRKLREHLIERFNALVLADLVG